MLSLFRPMLELQRRPSCVHNFSRCLCLPILEDVLIRLLNEKIYTLLLSLSVVSEHIGEVLVEGPSDTADINEGLGGKALCPLHWGTEGGVSKSLQGCCWYAYFPIRA